MPQTPPAHFLMPRKLTDTELAQAIRLDLESELDAFNLYQSHLDATDNELAKKVLAHIRDEEREHATLFWQLLRELDPKLAEDEASAPLKVRLIAKGAGDREIEAAAEAVESGAGPAEASGAKTVPRELTVGSLRGR